MQWQVALNNDSFDQAGITKDCQDAVCEYIWNSFEAGASKVSVSITGRPLQKALSLVVTDNGTGIVFDNLNKTFGTFLSSLKNNATLRLKSQSNKGKGRFSYQSFSHSAEWRTVYRTNDKLMQYTISTNSVNRNQFTTTEPVDVTDITETGTTVTFSLEDSNTVDLLSFEAMKQKLLEEFAWYLFLNKDKGYILEYTGTSLDISKYIRTDLSRNCLYNIGNHDFSIDVIVWNSSVSNSSKIYYRTEKGEIAATQNTSFNKNTVKFYHAVFVSSKYFVPDMFIPAEDDSGQTEMDSFSQVEQRSVFRELNKHIRSLVADVLKTFLIQQADTELSKMEQKGNFPRFPDDEYGKLRKKDFETVTRELYCVEPRIFHKLNDTQEKSLLGFLNLLLSSEERENVLQIVEQVVNLTSEQRKNFADVLKRSQLQYIVEAISIIEKRISVIEALKKIVFDYTEFANERDHVQKLIEQHFWLFGEQYHMISSY